MRKKTGKGPLCLGLTGSIGMGKSTAAEMFSSLGVPVFCADKAAREAVENEPETIKKIRKAFPEVVKKGKVDRGALGACVFEDQKSLEKLENILHPRVESARKRFLEQARKKKKKIVLFDIPLLFETCGEKNCHAVICVSAPKSVQKKRVLSREGMTLKKFQAVLKRQFPDVRKRRLADFVLRTDKGKKAMRRQIKAFCVLLEKVFL